MRVLLNRLIDVRAVVLVVCVMLSGSLFSQEARTHCEETSGFNVLFLGSGAAFLTWDNIPAASKYRVLGRLAGTSSYTEYIIPGDVANFLMIGLVSGNSYEWTVQARCKNFDGSVEPTAIAPANFFTYP